MQNNRRKSIKKSTLIGFHSATIINFLCICFFIWTVTAGFNRGPDLIASIKSVTVLAPSIILSLISFYKMFRKPFVDESIVSLYIFILFVSSFCLVQNVVKYGWYKQRIVSDSIKITSDEKYEYRTDLVNAFQKNSYIRLYIKDLSTDKEMKLKLDVDVTNIRALSIGDDTAFTLMQPTPTSNIYILTTTEELEIIAVCEINISNKTAIRLSD